MEAAAAASEMEQVKDLGPLETSPQDDRSYRAIELANGLQVREHRAIGMGAACIAAS